MSRRIALLVILGLFLAQGLSASGGQTVRIVDIHSWETGVCAEIVNDTDYTVHIETVVFYLLDDDGVVIGTVEDIPGGYYINVTYILGPGQRTIAFTSPDWWERQYFPELPPFSSARAEVIWEPITGTKTINLEVLGSVIEEIEEGSEGRYIVTALVRNPSYVTLTHWGITVGLYDAAGHLIGADSYYGAYHLVDWVLRPGAERQVYAHFKDDDLDPAATPTTCRVYATGWYERPCTEVRLPLVLGPSMR